MRPIFFKWIRSIDFLVFTAVLVVVSMGAYVFKDFVVYAFTSNMALNSMIIGALLVGSFMIYQQSYLLFRERYLIRWWHEEVRKAQQIRHARPDFAGRCLANDLIDRVDRMGADAGFVLTADVVEAEVERIAHQFDYNQELCRFMVGLMVALGLLGTFVGLLETLVQVSDLVGSIGAGLADTANAEASMTNVILGLKNPMKAMGTAFSASMFGLLGSIVLGVQMVRLSATTSAANRDIRILSLRAMEMMSADHPKSNSVEGLLKEYVYELGNQGRQISASLEKAAAVSNTALPLLIEISEDMRNSASQTEGLATALKSSIDAMQVFKPLPELLLQSILLTRELSTQAAESHQVFERIEKNQESVLTAIRDIGTVIAMGFDKADRYSEKLAHAITDGFQGSKSDSGLITAELAEIQQDIHRTSISLVESITLLSVSVADGKADAKVRFDSDKRQMAESLAQAGRALEYLAQMQSSMSAIPGLTRDLRTMVAELPRRDEALSSFSLAVERFNGALSSLAQASEEPARPKA